MTEFVRRRGPVLELLQAQPQQPQPKEVNLCMGSCSVQLSSAVCSLKGLRAKFIIKGVAVFSGCTGEHVSALMMFCLVVGVESSLHSVFSFDIFAAFECFEWGISLMISIGTSDCFRGFHGRILNSGSAAGKKTTNTTETCDICERLCFQAEGKRDALALRAC